MNPSLEDRTSLTTVSGHQSKVSRLPLIHILLITVTAMLIWDRGTLSRNNTDSGIHFDGRLLAGFM
jgi:hypothetical protein